MSIHLFAHNVTIEQMKLNKYTHHNEILYCGKYFLVMVQIEIIEVNS